MIQTFELPIQDNPPIMTLNYEAGYLGMLFNVKDFYKYFYSDYINIFYSIDSNYLNFLTERCLDDNYFFDEVFIACSDEQNITDYFGENYRNVIKTMTYLQPNNIIESIKTMIKAGFYISGMIDEYYVPMRGATGKYHFNHDFYINGYNEETNSLLLNGYSTNLKFEKVQISFKDFIDGVSKVNMYQMLKFFKLRNHYDFRINIYKIKNLLFYYLYSNNSYNNASHNPHAVKNIVINESWNIPLTNIYYGIDVYNRIISSCSNTNVKQLDIKIFRKLVEHKECMLTRFNILGELGLNINRLLIDEYVEILRNQKKIFNLVLKYNENLKDNVLKKICCELRTIKCIEFDVLNKVYKLILTLCI